MKMKFKTNLNCGGCVSKVQSDLDNIVGVSNWNVDLTNPNKILSVQTEEITEEEILRIIKSKGFNAEVLEN
jgi:copper chaperone